MRADELLKRLPDGPVTGAEIGVYRGKMSQILLRRDDLTLLMVDPWLGFCVEGAIVVTDADQELNLGHALADTEFANGRRVILRKSSVEAAEEVADWSLDFVFIDANHLYESVTADIRAWAPKVRPGGLLCGHDYANREPGGMGHEVKRAVDEMARAQGWKVELGGDYTWFVRL